MSSVIDSPLYRLLEPLDDLEYTATHVAVGDDNLVEKLYILLNIENQPPSRRFAIELFFINDVLEAFGGSDDQDDSMLAQFTMLMPLVAPAGLQDEIGRCLSLLNRMTPLGVFGVSPDDEAIYLRYTLATESREIPESLLLQVVSIFEYLCQENMPVFEAICSQTLTAQTWADQFAKSGHPIPSMGNPRVFISES